ncbi:hypothetical protein [Nonomuraea fuscirosea]|uniref:hypothetical protein n=1 Tax=Nonomuraea fuscirosea TaxID=1291556 RepID=UPI0033F669B1
MEKMLGSGRALRDLREDHADEAAGRAVAAGLAEVVADAPTLQIDLMSTLFSLHQLGGTDAEFVREGIEGIRESLAAQARSTTSDDKHDINRAQLHDELLEWLGQPGVLVLSGISGCGKTTFARQLAAGARRQGICDLEVSIDVGLTSPAPDGARVVASPAQLQWELRNATGGTAFPGGYHDDQLHGRRLLVLDGVTEIDALLTLFSPDGRVILISEEGLPPLDDAWRSREVHLGPLMRDDAEELLEWYGGRGLIERDPDAADRILRACGGIALSLSLMGARMKVLGTFTPMTEHTDGVEDAAQTVIRHPRLTNPVVVGPLEYAYRGLRPDERDLFRAVGLAGLPAFDLEVAAAAVGREVITTRPVLDRLGAAHFAERLTSDEQGLWRMHELVAAFAYMRGLELPDEHRREVAERVLNLYVKRASSLIALLNSPMLKLNPELEVWARRRLALQWEQFVAALRAAAGRTASDVAVKLARLVMGLFRYAGSWADARPAMDPVLQIARDRNDRELEVEALRRLSEDATRRDEPEEAVRYAERAREVADEPQKADLPEFGTVSPDSQAPTSPHTPIPNPSPPSPSSSPPSSSPPTRAAPSRGRSSGPSSGSPPPTTPPRDPRPSRRRRARPPAEPTDTSQDRADTDPAETVTADQESADAARPAGEAADALVPPGLTVALDAAHGDGEAGPSGPVLFGMT